MSNVEADPTETVCASEEASGIEVIDPREVPLGGPRAMGVRRTLPLRGRTLIGSWCFVDHYGPDDVSETGGMRVPRHPHTGLATVSWLFSGEIDHLDSAGNSARVVPGTLALMVAGHGISHQEFSTPSTSTLHGTQLWYALPDSARHREPDFAHFVPEPVTGDGWTARVFLGSLLGSTSPVETHTKPLLGAELLLEAGAGVELDVDPGHELGFLVDTGSLDVDGRGVEAGQLAYVPTGRSTVRLTAGDGPVRALALGGEPLGEEIVMWWNFVGRDHADIAEARRRWQDEITREDPGPAADQRFGPYPGGEPAALPAPTLPNARLRPRR